VIVQLRAIVATEAKVLRWSRRWRERDDRRLVKRAGPLPDVDPIAELIRIVSEAQERDADDERRLYFPMPDNQHLSYPRRRPERR
jgi:hypothetical protein